MAAWAHMKPSHFSSSSELIQIGVSFPEKGPLAASASQRAERPSGYPAQCIPASRHMSNDANHNVAQYKW